MGALIRWIQIGNWLSKSYKENASTDTATVVGGVSVSAAAAAIMTTLMLAKPDLGITAELIAMVTALIGGAATQIAPMLKHWRDVRRAKSIAGADPLPVGTDLLQPVRISMLGGADVWTEFRGDFQAAVNEGATLIHCANENVYRPSGELMGHMPLPPSMKT